jgi:hypothetical protein
LCRDGQRWKLDDSNPLITPNQTGPVEPDPVFRQCRKIRGFKAGRPSKGWAGSQARPVAGMPPIHGLRLLPPSRLTAFRRKWQQQPKWCQGQLTPGNCPWQNGVRDN